MPLKVTYFKFADKYLRKRAASKNDCFGFGFRGCEPGLTNSIVSQPVIWKNIMAVGVAGWRPAVDPGE